MAQGEREQGESGENSAIVAGCFNMQLKEQDIVAEEAE